MNRDKTIAKIEEIMLYCPQGYSDKYCKYISCTECRAIRIYNALQSTIDQEILKNSMPMEWINAEHQDPLQDGFYYVKDIIGRCYIAKWHLCNGWITHNKKCRIEYWSPTPISK